jgi:hypothetical protein
MIRSFAEGPDHVDEAHPAPRRGLGQAREGALERLVLSCQARKRNTPSTAASDSSAERPRITSRRRRRPSVAGAALTRRGSYSRSDGARRPRELAFGGLVALERRTPQQGRVELRQRRVEHREQVLPALPAQAALQQARGIDGRDAEAIRGRGRLRLAARSRTAARPRRARPRRARRPGARAPRAPARRSGRPGRGRPDRRPGCARSAGCRGRRRPGPRRRVRARRWNSAATSEA